jgi:hypothetical protein
LTCPPGKAENFGVTHLKRLATLSFLAIVLAAITPHPACAHDMAGMNMDGDDADNGMSGRHMEMGGAMALH